MSGNLYFSGLGNEKPSSRGRAPPSSNIIFGTDYPTTTSVNKAKAPREQENIQSNSKVFMNERGQASSDHNTRYNNNTFADQNKATNNGANSNKSRYNPITGQEYVDQKNVEHWKKPNETQNYQQQYQQQQQPQQHFQHQQQPQQSTPANNSMYGAAGKMSQPPGGRSNQLW